MKPLTTVKKSRSNLERCWMLSERSIMLLQLSKCSSLNKVKPSIKTLNFESSITWQLERSRVVKALNQHNSFGTSLSFNPPRYNSVKVLELPMDECNISIPVGDSIKWLVFLDDTENSFRFRQSFIHRNSKDLKWISLFRLLSFVHPIKFNSTGEWRNKIDGWT